MKEENKSNPQSTNPNMDGNSENLPQENFNANIKAEDITKKRLEDKPGAFLLKEISVDEEDDVFAGKGVVERADLEEEITEIDEGEMFNDDELNFDPFVEDDD